MLSTYATTATPDPPVTSAEILANLERLCAELAPVPRWKIFTDDIGEARLRAAGVAVPPGALRVIRPRETQVCFPRSKRRRIRKKWRKDRRNWRTVRVFPEGEFFKVNASALMARWPAARRWP